MILADIINNRQDKVFLYLLQKLRTITKANCILYVFFYTDPPVLYPYTQTPASMSICFLSVFYIDFRQTSLHRFHLFLSLHFFFPLLYIFLCCLNFCQLQNISELYRLLFNSFLYISIILLFVFLFSVTCSFLQIISIIEKDKYKLD